MNNKGFTLIELLATILVLALVMSIASYSIINVIRSAKQKNYELLISHIKDASETYFLECKYSNYNNISCNSITDGYQATLGELVTYGFLKGNDPDNNNSLINPLNNSNINNCQINITYRDGYLNINNNGSSDCPDNYGSVETEYVPGNINEIDRGSLDSSIQVPSVIPKLK